MSRRVAFALGLASSMLVLAAVPARAHASLLGSEPAAGEELARAPSVVVLDLSEEADPSASDIRVLSTQGALVSRGNVTAPSKHRLQVAVGDLGTGVYTVTWRVLSRVDGHVTGGAFAFGVGVSPKDFAPPPQEALDTPRPSPIGVTGRWLLCAGLALLVGAAWVVGFALRVPPLSGGRALWTGWTAAVAGIVLIALAQMGDAGVSAGDVFGTSIGSALAARAIPLAFVLVALLAVRPMRARAVVAGIGALIAVGTHVANGHAGSGGFRQVAIQSAHFAAAAAWIGGLAMVASTLRTGDADERARAVSRYSAAALWAVVMLVAAGSMRSLTEIKPLRSLWSTGYGRLVMVKVGLLVVLVVLGGVNRYRMLPRVRTDHGGLRRIAVAELVLATVVFATTGVLTGIAPARTAIAVERAGARATGSDAGTTLRATLTATPGTAGPNRFELSLRDYDSGDPVFADEVRATFRLVGEDVEPTSLTFARSDDTYTATGSVLAVPGPWEVTLVVRRGVGSTEVRMPLFPRADLPTSSIPGDPTIYTIELAEGRSVQMYLDPARAGKSEVHATWFEPGFKELKGLRDMVLVATPPGRTSEALAARVLSPGHAVASTQLTPGTWRFDARAITENGSRLWGMFEVTVRR